MIKDEKYLINLIQNLIKFPNETEWLEFKTNYYNNEAIAEYVSALSNSATLHSQNFAYMIWGVDDTTHDIIGTDFNPDTKKVGNEEFQNWLFRMINPKINIEFYTLYIDNKKLVVLEIPKAQNILTKFKTTGYIRIGSVKKSLHDAPAKEKELWKFLNSLPFEDSISAENMSKNDILTKLNCESYFKLLNIPVPEDDNGILHFLLEDKLIKKENTGNYSISNLGALLFARNFNEFSNIRRKGVRIIHYKGNTKLETIKEYTTNQGFAFDFENIIETILNILPKKEVIGRALRKEVCVYPELSIREVVANSIVHQDFTLTGTSTMIEIFDDRIEITNPGIPLIDKDRFLDNPPKSRNEEFASFLRRIGVCEERGSGFDKIVAESEIYELPAPKIDIYKEHTKITLYSHTTYSKLTREDKLRACYLHSCLKYINNDYLTNTSLRERFKIDPKNNAMVSRLIKIAIDEKLIKPYGEVSAPRYIKYIPYWG